MRVAFLADIHGNLPALEAVAADIDKQAPDAVYLVGDQVNRCPWSNEVMDLVADRGWPAIRGNHEAVLTWLAKPHDTSPFDNRTRFPDLWWTLEQLGMRRLRAIADWPEDMRIDLDGSAPIRVIHGVPGNPFRGLFVETESHDIADALQDVAEEFVVCGHTHRPLHRTVGHWTILNGGSVGIPYNGDPRAQYLMLSSERDTWISEYRRVTYPVASVREAFRQNGLAQALGPMASIYLRTIDTAQPWASDFGHWLGAQSSELQADLAKAVAMYEAVHGPGNWSFQEI